MNQQLPLRHPVPILLVWRLHLIHGFPLDLTTWMRCL